MHIDNYKSKIEAFLFAWGEPILIDEIGKLLELDIKTLHLILKEMQCEYEKPIHGIRLIFIEKSVQLVTKSEVSDLLKKMNVKNKEINLSQSALELIAIIAYKQPVTKAEVESIRGVRSDSLIQRLLDLKLLKIVGKKEVPGRPFLYGTTQEFLKFANVEKISNLPDYYTFKIREVSE